MKIQLFNYMYIAWYKPALCNPVCLIWGHLIILSLSPCCHGRGDPSCVGCGQGSSLRARGGWPVHNLISGVSKQSTDDQCWPHVVAGCSLTPRSRSHRSCKPGLLKSLPGSLGQRGLLDSCYYIMTRPEHEGCNLPNVRPIYFRLQVSVFYQKHNRYRFKNIR